MCSRPSHSQIEEQTAQSLITETGLKKPRGHGAATQTGFVRVVIGFASGVFGLLLCVVCVASAAPRMGIMHWPEEDHPLWGPRLEKALRNLVEADTTFAGAIDLEAIAARERITLSSAQFLNGGSKTLAATFGVDYWARLELAEAEPLHKVSRHTWMPWKATETWAMPLRLTVWDAASGRVKFSGLVPGEVTEAANRFWPYRSYASYSFTEKEKKREDLLVGSLIAARDTLARIASNSANTQAATPATTPKPGLPSKSE